MKFLFHRNCLATIGAIWATALSVNAASLRWDALEKEYRAKPGESSGSMVFAATNTTAHDVMVTAVSTSCGCTVAKVPELPWRISPGATESMEVTVNWVGKTGVFAKTVTVDTAEGRRLLTVKVDTGIAVADAVDAATLLARAQNIQVAISDRQAVFTKPECATCHAVPGAGKLAGPLYQVTCAICHDSAHRASMVPDLHAIAQSANAASWQDLIARGKANSLMPAFARAEGGPLDDQQIQSLVEYLIHEFPAPKDRKSPASNRP